MTTSSSYNFDHFRRRHLIDDTMGTLAGVGVPPGDPAPEFDLPLVGGGTFRLSDRRDRPVLLRFGSFT